nr:hypothetical protein CKG001_14720 [Bdellovibrio sp. CKG001]
MHRVPIIIVTCYYPPINHIASLRIGSFGKYFDKNKYDVHVIVSWTAEGPPPSEDQDVFGNKVYYVRSKPIISDLTQAGDIGWCRHKFLALKNKLLYFFCSDENPQFTEKATKLALTLIDRLAARVVITSFGPRSPLIAGLRIKLERPSVMWVSDLRDELATAEKMSPFVRRAMVSLERKMIKYADVVTSVSKPMLEVIELSERYSEKLFEVRNGFDGPLYLQPQVVDNVFLVTYAGSFYGTRKPDNFFEALKIFVMKSSDVKILVEFYGVGKSILVPEGLSRYVRVFPRIEYRDVQRKIENSSALLLIQPTDRRMGVFTGKLFDYLAFNRPILGLVNPSDVAAALIKEANAGYVCDNGDIVGIVAMLEKAYSDWLSKNGPQRNWDVVQKCHRRWQFQVLENAISSRLKP